MGILAETIKQACTANEFRKLLLLEKKDDSLLEKGDSLLEKNDPLLDEDDSLLKGCDLHLISEYPDNVNGCANSYIFINNHKMLLYVDSNEVEAWVVTIDDMNQFERDLSKIDKKDNAILHLSSQQVKNLITLNGGHIPPTQQVKNVTTLNKSHTPLLEKTTKKYTQEEWNESLCMAIKYDRPELVILLKEFANSEHALCLDTQFLTLSEFPWELVYPLGYAIKKNSVEMVRTLIDLGANVNIACSRKPGKDVSHLGGFLQLAAQQGNVTTIKMLLNHGATRHWSFEDKSMASTVAIENGKGDAFIEAVGGILTEHELLDLVSKYPTQHSPEARFIDNILLENKVKIQMDKPLEYTSKETKAERQILLSPQTYLDFITNFPSKEIWRLFVDGENQRWYDLDFISKIRGDTAQPNMLYLSEAGDRYLIPRGLVNPEGSLLDLSDLEMDIGKKNEKLQRIKSAFETWKKDPMQSLELKNLILGIALERDQIALPQNWADYLFKIENNPYNREENGWCGYELREPGCINTMYSAFEQACLNKKELSVSFISNIHAQAMAHKKNFKDKFDTEAEYGLVPRKNLSYLGYLELSKAPYDNWNRFVWAENCGNLRVMKKNGSQTDLEQIINQYNQSQKDTHPTDREQILKNIILLASRYARLHPRGDGNNRTATILLNSELIKQGFMPVILENPNRLEGFAQIELLEEVYQGMCNMRHVMKYGCYPGGKLTEEYKGSISAVLQRNISDTLATSFAVLAQTLKEKLFEPSINVAKSLSSHGFLKPSTSLAAQAVANELRYTEKQRQERKLDTVPLLTEPSKGHLCVIS